MNNKVQNDVSSEFNSMIAGYREMKNELMGVTQEEVEQILAPAFDLVKRIIVERGAAKESTLVSFYVPVEKLDERGQRCDAYNDLQKAVVQMANVLDEDNIDHNIAMTHIELGIQYLARTLESELQI